MCHQLEIDGGGWTKGPFFSPPKKKKNRALGIVFIWIFSHFIHHVLPWQD
jgi:hypothetical protein